MFLKFMYFIGDRVRNLHPHMDTEGNVIPVNCSGRVTEVSNDYNMVTVEWDGVTPGHAVTTSVQKDTLIPLMIPPSSQRE